MSEKNFTREEYVYLSKLYEKAEKYNEMFKYVNKFVELEPKLTKDERNILSSGYKNIVSNLIRKEMQLYSKDTLLPKSLDNSI